eukprot:GHVL01044172.1.p1 GENE.GHVL01044172.1~~GHVL01044172.1.p1  ORF type:complete len:105 (+),score=9.92 GHVL01044172.1:211-525(+)
MRFMLKASDICIHIKKTFKVSYTVNGMTKWLNRNGFSYKEPKGYPYKADLKAQEDFANKYKKLKKELSDDETLVFGDGVHPTMATKISRGWIKKELITYCDHSI